MGPRLISGAYNGINSVGLYCFLPQLTYARSGRGTTLLVKKCSYSQANNNFYSLSGFIVRDFFCYHSLSQGMLNDIRIG